MNYAEIKNCDIANGPGVRVSLFVSGCTHHCPGCHNPQSWDFAAGEEISVEALLATLLEDEAPVTLSGGDPLQQPTAELLTLLQGLKTAGVNVWCYTGYTFEQLLQCDKAPLLAYIDVVVDGAFVIAQRDTSLRFRGSANQRIIDVAASLAAGTAILTPYQSKA